VQHSAKNFLFFSKFFAECHSAEALGKACFYFFLKFSLPSATAKALGKAFFIFYLIFFAECNGHCTRQIWEIVAAIFPALPSAMVIALGKATAKFLFLFFAFPCKQQCIYIY